MALLDGVKISGMDKPEHNLRFIRSSTMPLASATRAKLEAIFQVPVLEVYGMTEAASQICSQRIPENGMVNRSGTVGMAAGPDVTVLTPSGEHCLFGVTGEVAIRGESVTSGYEGTDQSGWILNARGEHWFLTGDIGYLDEHAHLTLTGRLKEIINRGGIKISPVRVDEALNLHPAVEEALAFSLPHPTLGEDLLAAVVLRTGSTENEQDLRSYLIQTLPSHEVPSSIIIVSSLPRANTGKLQRKGLAHWIEHLYIDKNLPLQDSLEQFVAFTFAKVLRLKNVSRNANFFMLGGDSLSSFSVIIQLEDKLKIELDPTLIFSYPSVQILSHQLEKLLSGAKDKASMIAAILPVKRIGGYDAFHASFGQARLWYIQKTEPERNAYHLIAAWRLQGKLNQHTLDLAMTALINRHSTLRTSFFLQDDKLLQIINPSTNFVIEKYILGERDADQVIKDLLNDEAKKPFDLESGQLIRGKILSLSEDEYIFILNHHHIASDGWSRNILAEDLVTLYNSIQKGLPSKLHPHSLQYQDYAAWQRDRLNGNRLEDLLEYWTKQLNDLEPIKLQTGTPQSFCVKSNGASKCFEIAPTLLNSFESLCKSESATLHMGFLAAIALLLNRVYEQDDFAIGVPILGRNDPRFESLIGFFVNTLPIRVRFVERQSFRQLLAQVRDTSLDAYRHQELPFEQMVKALNTNRDTRRNPLFQVMLQFISIPVASLSGMMGLQEVERLTLPPVDSRFDMEFLLRSMSDGTLKGELIYDSSLFHSTSIDLLIERFHIFLKALILEPDISTAHLNILPPEEREIIESWQLGTICTRLDSTIDELFFQQVERSPEAIALVFENRQLSYAELDLQANKLAHSIANNGVGPDAIIAVSLDTSIERLVSILAILKLGCAYLPIDSTWPEERRHNVLKASGANVIITDRDATLTDKEMQLQLINPNAATLQKEGDCVAIKGLSSPSSLAYVLYTSGSTGQPKGVAMPHSSLINLLLWQQDCSEVRARTLQFANIGFDVSFQEIFSTWISGGTLVLVSDTVKRDPSCMLSFLKNNSIERLFLPVVMLNYLAQVALLKNEYALSLKEIIVAGEALLITPEIRALFKRMPNCRLWNHYGPTETHVVTAHLLSVEPNSWTDTPPIGKPIPNTKVCVLDRNMQMTPIGQTGDIWIGGMALARGYFRNSKLTQERFIPDPLDKNPINKLYRTGDRGRWREDGQIEFLGRTDHQIKIRGHRVEIGEVEATLCKHPDIKAAVVVIRENDSVTRSMVGFVVSREDLDLKSLSLRSWLRARLPEPMVPSQFIILSTLPLNTNGKVDRKILEHIASKKEEEIYQAENEANNFTHDKHEDIALKTLLESQIIKIWQRLFKKENIDLSSDFFELGGDSLSAVQMVLELEKLLGHSIPISMLFDAPTIELLTKSLSMEQWIPEWTSLIALQPNGSRSPIFLVHGLGGDVFHFAQFARAISSDQPVYGIRYTDTITKGVQLKTLEESAKQYADEICALCTQGPYFLGGYSLGGWYSYAVATELLRRGAEVKLILFDTYPYCITPWPAAGIHYLINLFKHLKNYMNHFLNIIKLKPNQWVNYISTRVLFRRIKQKIFNIYFKEKSSTSVSYTDNFIEATAKYSARPIKVELHFFQAKSPHLRLPLKLCQAIFWRLLVRGPVHFHHLDCSHDEIFSSANIEKLSSMVNVVTRP
jgi:amino acid adenylation domain-containing protein